MKIRIVSPIVGDWLVNESIQEANQFKAPDTEIDAVGLDKGPTSIESIYDEILANPYISGISHSKLTYPLPREKERVF